MAGSAHCLSLCMDRNYGFAEGYNRALRHVEADYYLLLNSDIETPAGWLAPLVECLDRYLSRHDMSVSLDQLRLTRASAQAKRQKH